MQSPVAEHESPSSPHWQPEPEIEAHVPEAQDSPVVQSWDDEQPPPPPPLVAQVELLLSQ